jgi:A/G-specific adenine glycosylase
MTTTAAREHSSGFADAGWRRAFRRRLTAWYDRHARDLPWRRRRDPYAVWLSEIMLQQTQVATVKPYFTRFLQAFPTLEALARADEHDVLRRWEGLGYYRRARQLHRAARIIVAEHGGEFPRDPPAVRRLPGVGRYTAGAILSIAFDARVPILEANTVRLLSRLSAYRADPSSAAGQSVLWSLAEAVLPRREPGRFNQALMELGSEVCLGRAPHCGICPVASLCQANLQGLQREIPLKKAKPRPEAVREAAVLVRRRGRVLLLRWPEGRRWAGLWDFPRFALHQATAGGRAPRAGVAGPVVGTRRVPSTGRAPRAGVAVELPPQPTPPQPTPPQRHIPAALRRELVENVRQLTGLIVAPGEHLKTLTHGVTRFRITLECYRAEYVSSARDVQSPLETRWLRPSELQGYPLSSTGRRLARLVGDERRTDSERASNSFAGKSCRTRPRKPGLHSPSSGL